MDVQIQVVLQYFHNHLKLKVSIIGLFLFSRNKIFRKSNERIQIERMDFDISYFYCIDYYWINYMETKTN